MDKAPIFNETILKRIPLICTLVFVILLGSPAVALHYFGKSINAIENDNILDIFITATHLQDYLIQMFLRWSAFTLSVVTALLAFTQYRLTNNKIALLISLSIFFSSSIEGFPIFFNQLIDSLTLHVEGENMLLWAIPNAISGFVFVLGFIWLKNDKYLSPYANLRQTVLHGLGILLGLIALYYITFILQSSFHWLPRPYEILYLTIYALIIVFFYPYIYKQYPNILTHCILYMAITQLAIAIYLIGLSHSSNETAYDVAYFLKIIVYLIPFSCLITNYIFSYHSILETQNKLQLSQEKLSYMASHDALTNLYNRREFENLLDKTIENYARAYESFALFLIDIDNFKTLNDTLGHLHGDSLLKRFAEQLTTLTRQEDIISRIGGDEFTVIMPKLSSFISAQKFAERLITDLNIPYLIDEKHFINTVSIGIALYPMDGRNTQELLKNADIAMYNAKKMGKNTYRFYNDRLGSVNPDK